MRVALVAVLVAIAAVVAMQAVNAPELVRWAAEQQRAFQNEMAVAVRALQTGAPEAWAALLAAAGAYGFVHAVGPGHGKYLIGGVGLGSSVPAGRLVGIALISSLAQALWAILLVYGGFFLLDLSASRMTSLAEDYLAPASHLAIAAIGVVLVWRGIRMLAQHRQSAVEAAGVGHHHHHHDHHPHGQCGCHSHGPTPDEVARLRTLRDALTLIASIAIRPCTGAIFLLVIAWHMEIQAAGAVAVIVMGLGTAALTSLVAVSSIAARGLTFASAGSIGAAALAVPTLQVVAGAMIVWISLVMLGTALP